MASLPLKALKASGKKETVTLTDEQILVTFEFPDGGIAEHEFQMGQTVEVLKAYIESEFDIAMSNIELEYHNQVMMNPLSLSDFTSNPENGLDVFVVIDGDVWDREGKCK